MIILFKYYKVTIKTICILFFYMILCKHAKDDEEEKQINIIMTESQGCWKLDMRVFIEVHLGIAR